MIDKFQQDLRAAGYSITPQRLAVFGYLRSHDQVTMRDLIAASQDMDQASVYRTIQLFKRLGVVRDVVALGVRMIELTDAYDSHHHHISCLKCGRSVIIQDAFIEQRLHALALSAGISPVSHQVEITGICTDCVP